jgi:hypothetical protein
MSGTSDPSHERGARNPGNALDGGLSKKVGRDLYGFQNIFGSRAIGIQTTGRRYAGKLLKVNIARNGPSIAIVEGASDVPAAAKVPVSPKTKQAPGKSHPPTSGPEREDRPREPEKSAVERTIATIRWEASDQRKNVKRHSPMSGVFCLRR